jgi:hypothetical protein
VHLLVDVHEAIDDPIFGLSLIDDQDRLVFATTTIWQHQHTGAFAPGEQVELIARFENVFTPGRYFLTPFIAHAGRGDRVMDLREAFASVLVIGTRPSVAVVDLPHELTIERVGASQAIESAP